MEAQGRRVKEQQAVEQGRMVQKKVQVSHEVKRRKLDSPNYLPVGQFSTEELKAPDNHILRPGEEEGEHYQQPKLRLQIAWKKEMNSPRKKNLKKE